MTNQQPTSVAQAVVVTPLASGATVLALNSPCGRFGFRLSGYALHPEHFPAHRQRSAGRRLNKTVNTLQSRADALRAILGSYLDDDGIIIDGRSFRRAFTLDADPACAGRYLSVVSDRTGEHRYVLDTHTDYPDYPGLVASMHDRLVANFLDWIGHDRRRRAARRAIAA